MKPRLHSRTGSSLVLAFALVLPALAYADLPSTNLIREENAVYLEDILEKEIKLKVVKQAPVYSTLEADRWLGNLVAPGDAVLLAVSDRAWRVRARAQQGQVAGWVSPAAFEGLSEEALANLKKFCERQLIVQDLISKNQVALGMTIEEVMTSLGKPDEKSSKIDQEGRTDTLEYITYEKVPQTTTRFDALGRPFRTTVYVKVPTGRVSINFANEVVTSIEETEGAPDFGGGVKIVPPPIILF